MASEAVVERVRQQLGLTLEEKMTGRGALLLVQSAILPPGSAITHTPCDKIRCGDVLCRVDGKDIRFMSFAEAGDILLKTVNSDITLGFVSAVQRGYDVCVSRALAAAPAPSEEAAVLAGDSKRHSGSTATNCSKRGYTADSQSESSPTHNSNSDSILARLDAEITQLKKYELSPPSSKMSRNSADHCCESSANATTHMSSCNEVSSSASTFTRSNAKSPPNSSVMARAAQHEQKWRGDEASTPAQESSVLVKQLKGAGKEAEAYVQTLVAALQASEQRANAAESRAAALEELVKEAERRAKASETRLGVIKAELGALKEQGKLAGFAAKIHDSMLTPKRGPSMLHTDESLPACIPEKPLLQNNVPKTVHQTYQALQVPSAGSPGLYASWGGRKQQHRSCNFVYANGLSAYPPSRSAHGDFCSDPLSNCPPQDRKESLHGTNFHATNAETLDIHVARTRPMFCRGDELEARLLGVHSSEIPVHPQGSQGMTDEERLQRLVKTASLIGGFSNTNGQNGQLAIAFVSDLIPTWQSVWAGSSEVNPPHGAASTQRAYLNESMISADLSHNISRELSMSTASSESPADYTPAKRNNPDCSLYASAPECRSQREMSPMDSNARVPHYSYF